MKIALILTFCLLFTGLKMKAQTSGCDSLIIPNVITPNNDGFNDTWIIGCIENFPDNEVQIFNRWGSVVYEAFGYDNNWNGYWEKTKGALPAGTYVYVISYKINGNEKTLTGSLTLVL